MNNLHTTALCHDFPFLYHRSFYFECGDGWFNLIYDLSKKLHELLLEMPEESREWSGAVQVKEKFGTLRFYLATGTEKMFTLIEEAEKQSAKICEFCGNPGTICGGGWIKTLCTECHVNERI